MIDCQVDDGMMMMNPAVGAAPAGDQDDMLRMADEILNLQENIQVALKLMCRLTID